MKNNTYMTTADIPENGLTATIKEIRADKHPICYFEEDLNPLYLSGTNIRTIYDICEAASALDDPKGTTIHLYKEEITAIGGKLKTIRVRK